MANNAPRLYFLTRSTSQISQHAPRAALLHRQKRYLSASSERQARRRPAIVREAEARSARRSIAATDDLLRQLSGLDFGSIPESDRLVEDPSSKDFGPIDKMAHEMTMTEEFPERLDRSEMEIIESLDDEDPKEVGEFEEEPKWEDGYFAYGEEKDDLGPDPEFIPDDLSTDGHKELEQVRELRQFARVIVWDMPLLYKHAQPFKAPTAATPLRFRYTTYMGEHHPATKKVVLTFSAAAVAAHPDAQLTQLQLDKLIKLLGARYNPSTGEAHMSCELFPSSAQNKRRLGDLLDNLIHEAKHGTDTLADVPFDFRYHTPKKRFDFPDAWKATGERMQALKAGWAARARAEGNRISDGAGVDGVRLIEAHAQELSRRSEAQAQPQPVLQTVKKKR